jgi:hypothetical protein
MMQRQKNTYLIVDVDTYDHRCFIYEMEANSRSYAFRRQLYKKYYQMWLTWCSIPKIEWLHVRSKKVLCF